MVFVKVEVATLLLVQELTDTVRAAGGFGHTGVQ
jgi:dUTPase